MSDYIRTTRECSMKQLHPEILQAIRTYSREHQVGDLETEALMCCETISRKKSTAKMAVWLSGQSDATIYTGMLLTPEWLIWVHQGDQSGLLLNAANLKQIRAKFYTSPFTKDVGLEIAGYIGDTKDRIRGYIGMGTDPAAQKFCEKVEQAINQVNPPTKKGLFRWLTG